MEKTKDAIKDMECLKERLLTCLLDQVNMGIQNVNTQEAGQVVDMIEDLSEAIEKCWKGCYYKMIAEAMHKEKEMMEKMPPEQRMGYDNWRYSSGRYAPTGQGHYDPAGYTPMEDGQIPMVHDNWAMEPWMRAGYGDGRRSSSGSSSSSGQNYNSQNGSNSGNDRYGYTAPSMRGMHYDRYSRARRGYSEHKDPQSKTEMDASAKEYVVDMAESVREMWKDADPALRKEIKNHFVALTGEMN